MKKRVTLIGKSWKQRDTTLAHKAKIKIGNKSLIIISPKNLMKKARGPDYFGFLVLVWHLTSVLYIRPVSAANKAFPFCIQARMCGGTSVESRLSVMNFPITRVFLERRKLDPRYQLYTYIIIGDLLCFWFISGTEVLRHFMRNFPLKWFWA